MDHWEDFYSCKCFWIRLNMQKYRNKRNSHSNKVVHVPKMILKATLKFINEVRLAKITDLWANHIAELDNFLSFWGAYNFIRVGTSFYELLKRYFAFFIRDAFFTWLIGCSSWTWRCTKNLWVSYALEYVISYDSYPISGQTKKD